MEPRSVQRDRHTPEMQFTILKTNVFLLLFMLQVMSASGAEPTEADTNMTTSAPQLSNVEYGVDASQLSTNLVQVSTLVKINVFIGTLQGTLGLIAD